MKWLICIFCLAHSATSWCQHDSTKIITLLKNDYSTMPNLDLDKHKSNCTEDYLLIEAGDIWDMKREAQWYNDPSSKVTDRKDQFEFKYIRIEGNIAYAVYNLKSAIVKEGKLVQMNWNESAIFRRVKGEWKIALIHSTPVKE